MYDPGVHNCRTIRLIMSNHFHGITDPVGARRAVPGFDPVVPGFDRAVPVRFCGAGLGKGTARRSPTVLWCGIGTGHGTPCPYAEWGRDENHPTRLQGAG